MKGYGLMEDLAYTDRRMNDVIEACSPLEDSPDIKSSTKKKIVAMNAELEAIKDRMMVRNYGDLRGDSELRENLGFLYGTVKFFPGRPTNSQIRRMDELAVKVEDMAEDVNSVFENYLEGINAQLKKTGLDTVKVTTREEFDAEKK